MRLPQLGALRAALTSALDKGGPQTGAMVYDLTAKQPLFALRAGVGRPPASVEKLYTTVATLSELGPNARLETTIVGDGHLGPGGVWHGNLYLVGGGDPTFGDGAFNRAWEQGYGPTANDLVAQLVHDGIKRVTGWVIGDAALFDDLRGGPATGYAPDVPDFGGQLSASPTTTVDLQEAQPGRVRGQGARADDARRRHRRPAAQPDAAGAGGDDAARVGRVSPLS